MADLTPVQERLLESAWDKQMEVQRVGIGPEHKEHFRAGFVAALTTGFAVVYDKPGVYEVTQTLSPPPAAESLKPVTITVTENPVPLEEIRFVNRIAGLGSLGIELNAKARQETDAACRVVVAWTESKR